MGKVTEIAFPIETYRKIFRKAKHEAKILTNVSGGFGENVPKVDAEKRATCSEMLPQMEPEID